MINKPDLIDHIIASRENIEHEDVKHAVDLILDSIMGALASGGRVEIRGFGSFDVRYHQPRIGRNPRSGEQVNIPGRYVLYFKQGKELRECINEDRSID